jgi:drug/metabolite transporter (DMT)-like permease
MEWVFLSLISAFFLATSDALAKKAVQNNNEYLVAWFRLLYTLPFFIAVLFFIPVPELDRDFYRAFIIALPVEVITIILYIKALKLSPLSLTMPFLSLTPVFLIGVSYFVLGEKVTVMGGLGIFLIAAGGYLLNICEVKKGLLQPLLAILREKGSILMICVALLYSITSSMGKMAVEHSSALFFGSTYFIALNIIFFPIGFFMGRGALGPFIRQQKYKALFMPGACYALMVITHMSAIKLTKVAYMISVKRTSLLMGVLYGWFLFREENIRGRLIGASLMFAGFVLVVGAG